jgi:HD-GYP domain-containing protein (c-di-GMP phosphodiesterase class II)
VFDLILEACLNLSGATRGMYVTVREEEALRIRAAVGIDDYPDNPPSDYIRALCRKALESQESLVCNAPGELHDLPEPKDGEAFRNLIAAPVVLRQNLSGVIVVANKRRGTFDKHDAEVLVSVGDQASVAVENIRLRRQLQEAYLSTVGVLADAMEAKDSYTQGHCEAVSHYSRLIADRLELSQHDRSVVCYTALLHDVGKIGVSDAILNKPGPLLPHELELVRAHVRVGHSLLQRIPALQVVAEAVLHHHEWFDGSGYPDGLAGEQIPVASRIVAVVDAYSAMTTSRCYRRACSQEVAREELVRCAGTQFDPRVVEVFLSLLDEPQSRPGDDDDEPECGAPPGFHLAAEPPPSLSRSGAGKG